MPEIPGSDPSTLLDPLRPWPGLLSFTEANRGYFFGREGEIVEIVNRILENPLTILFSQSGLGKTSLLAAGVVPRLRENGKSPVLLRLDHTPSAPSLVEQTRQAFAQCLSPVALPPGSDTCTLWELFHRLPSVFGPETPVPVVILDQFEEIFTLGRQDETCEGRVADWLEQIADLIQNRPPRDLEERFAENRRLAREYDFIGSPVRVVFSLREDYLSHLEGWKGTLPSLTQNRMGLEMLDGPRALDAVLGPASLGASPLVSREVAISIVRTVARTPAETPLSQIRAVPPLLSLLCEQLNIARTNTGQEEIDADMVSARSDDIIHRFYEDSFSIFEPSHRDKIREVVEDRMVTVSGHRHPVARDDAEADLAARGVPQPKEVFDSLIRRRLLTSEERGGLQRLEITHDVLLPLVVRSRKERRDRKGKEAFDRRLAEEAAKARRRLVITSAMTILTLASLASAAFALVANHKANVAVGKLETNEGLGWLQRARAARDQSKQYPEALMFAAQAIGFEGVGKPADRPPTLLARKSGDQDSYEKAGELIANSPAYLPVWGEVAGGPVAALDVSPSGRLVAIGERAGAVRIFDLQTASTLAWDLAGTRAIRDIAFQPGTKILTVAASDGLHRWNWESGEVKSDPGSEPSALVFSRDGRYLAEDLTAGAIAVTGTDGRRLIQTGAGGTPTRFAASALNLVMAASFPGEGVRVFFPKVGAPAFCWQPRAMEGRDVRLRPPANLTALALSPDGSRLACGMDTGSIVICDTLRATPLGEIFPHQKHAGAVQDLQFREDGAQLASCGADGLVKLWDLTRDIPELSASLGSHVGSISRIRYLPGCDTLASAGEDGCVKIWNVSGQPAETLDLRYYLEKGWYEIDDLGELVACKTGRDSVNIPPGSLLQIWEKSSPEVPGYLLSKKSWRAAAEASAGFPAPLSAETLAKLAPDIVSEANAAAERADWNRFELLSDVVPSAVAEEYPTLLANRERKNSIAAEGKAFGNIAGMRMVWCPPGSFKMGSPVGVQGREERGEELRDVILSKGFWIGTCEVTQGQWISVMGGNPSVYREPNPPLKSIPDPRQLPVDSIDWDQAVEFCARLTDIESLRGTLQPGWEYSLPTQAQWEYACRAGTDTAYNFGPDRSQLYLHGNYRDSIYGYKLHNNRKIDADYGTDWTREDGFELAAPVGSFPGNHWGIQDMHGNVSEWTLDHLDMNNQPYYKPGDPPAVDPYFGEDPRRRDRIICGGSWLDSRNDNRTGRNFANRNTTRKWTIGMRVVLVPIRERPLSEIR